MPDAAALPQATELFQQGRYAEALRLLGHALAAAESAELWNDWAATQVALGQFDEALAGFRLALALDPRHATAALNLGVLLAQQGRCAEALPLLERGRQAPDCPAGAVSALQVDCRRQLPPPPLDPRALADYLGNFVSEDPNEQSYFQTHLTRYLSTIELLPPACAGRRVLELGAAFHHLTPALTRWKGYGEVRCSDVWEGAPSAARRLVSRDGRESCALPVDNFDVCRAPWPYSDGACDLVLFCEMLEHLATDPMAVLAEINRVLAPGGHLLLSTPNLASAKSVAYVLRGESPYVYGQFEPRGRVTDRHNREYTPGEVARLAAAAGFDCERLETRDSWWQPEPGLFARLASLGCPIAHRGDNIFLLARKSAPVRDRFPAEFYLNAGSQQQRRDHQSDSPASSAADPDPPAAQAAPSRVLVVHEVLPHTDRSGSDVRLLQIVRELCRQGHHVTYLARNGANRAQYAPALEALGVCVLAHDPARLRFAGCDDAPAWSLEDVLTQGRFHAAILCHWFWSGVSVTEHYLPLLRRLSPATRIAVLTDDRHGLRERRMAELTARPCDVERAADFSQREQEMYSCADLLLAITPEDREGISALAPGVPVELLPMAAAPGPLGPGFAERSGLLFIGNFDNLANREGVSWFLESVWPLLRRRLPDLHLFLVGNRLQDWLSQLPEGVVPVGHVPDLTPLFARHRVFVSPIRFGTGIKTKNLAALAHGLPLVTTTVGAEGMQLVSGRHAFIADDPAAFADAVCRTVTDPALFDRLAVLGRAHVLATFSEARVAHSVSAAMARLLAATPQPFDPSFTPSFLQVESAVPDLLTRPGNRWEARIVAYAEFADRLTQQNQFAAARDQLRHIFALLREPIPVHQFFQRVWGLLARCYQELGDEERCRLALAEAARHAPPSRRESPPAAAPRPQLAPAPPPPSPGPRLVRAQPAVRRPLFSVVIPTFNRATTLAKCLAALGRQTASSASFEVVVVDDGSTDSTESYCRSVRADFRLRYLRRENAGPGAARRAAVALAHGEYLLFFNDDTIAEPDLLDRHAAAHHSSASHPVAVLGDFRYPDAAARRALTWFLKTTPFLFMQPVMQPGESYDRACFMTCNLSLRRAAVLAVGNFDPTFRVAEDTELGTRLEAAGFRVRYHPEAVAWHDHLDFTSADLVRRARTYGPANLRLLRKHPRLLADGRGPFGRLDEAARAAMRAHVESHRAEMAEVMRALQRLDHLDFEPLLRASDSSLAQEIQALLAHLVPAAHTWHLFDSMLQAWDGESVSPVPAPQADLAAVSS